MNIPAAKQIEQQFPASGGFGREKNARRARLEVRYQFIRRALGANAQIMDGLDKTSVQTAVEATRPDVIVHQMTALTGIDMKDIDKAFHTTNRLRTEGTEHLIAAAPGTLLIAQSFAGWPSARNGGPVKTEADPLEGQLVTAESSVASVADVSAL